MVKFHGLGLRPETGCRIKTHSLQIPCCSKSVKSFRRRPSNEDCVQMLQAFVAHDTGLWSSAFGQDMRAMTLESAELSRQCPLPNRPKSTRPSLVQSSRGKAKSCSSKKKTFRGFPIVTKSDLGHWFYPWWCSNKKTFGPNEVEISSR